jgi:hypothetical protein
MGVRGPVPHRSDQRRRRNKPETAVQQVAVQGTVTTPPDDQAWHKTAKAWYASLRESGQSRFYESSDWQVAYVCASVLSRCLSAEVMSAELVGQVRGMMTDLLTTEGARRRVGVELERESARNPSSASVAQLEDRRRRRVMDAPC